MDLLTDQTYTPENFQAHILTFIKDNFIPPIAFHKEQVERLIRDITELRSDQKKIKAKQKGYTNEEARKAEALDRKCQLLLNQGYSIQRFLKQPPGQGDIFQ